MPHTFRLGAATLLLGHCLMFPLGLLGLYCLVVGRGYVATVLPHVALLGDFIPESSLFTHLLVMETGSLALLVQCRFVQVPSCRLNTVSMAAGYVSCLGLFIAACFQPSNLLAVNVTGHSLFYLSILLHLTLQSILTPRWRPLRGALCVLAWLQLLAGLTALLTSLRTSLTWQAHRTWPTTDPYWVHHVTSAACEWCLLFTIYLLHVSFYPELRRVVMTRTKINLIGSEEEIEEKEEPKKDETTTEDSHRVYAVHFAMLEPEPSTSHTLDMEFNQIETSCHRKLYKGGT